MNVILKNGDAMQVAENATCLQAASAISEGLARNAVCAKVNGEEVDLSHVLKEGDALEIVTLKDKASVHTKDDIHDFIQRIDDLRILATEYNIDILDGCELFLNHDYQKALDQNLFIPIENTQYVLVEFDVRKEIGNEQEVEERLYDVQFKGYTPIIAHVE